MAASSSPSCPLFYVDRCIIYAQIYKGTPDELAAFMVMYDYHLDRAAGPLIPTWMWDMREKELNQTWKDHRKCGEAAGTR